MTELLFDEIKRKPLGNDNPPTSAYQCLNKYEWPEGARIRELFESWFTRYPCEDQAELRSRFRLTENHAHEAALFELLLHELFTRLGCVLTVHPEISGVSTRPDFLVQYGEQNFFLEASTVGQELGPFTRNKNSQDVIDKINKLRSLHFYIGIHMEGELLKTLGRKDVVPVFQELLDDHDPDKVQQLIDAEGQYAAPSRRIECGNWSLEGWLYPVARESRERGSRRQQIVIEPFRAEWTNSVLPVQKALQTKARKYGQLHLPYIVAIKARDIFYNGRDNDLDVLFGKQQLLYSVENPDLPPQMVREPGGIWPRHSKIDAVMVFQKVDMWNVQNASVCLYLNPYKRSDPALPDILFRLPHAKGCDGIIEWFEGENVAELVGLS